MKKLFYIFLSFFIFGGCSTTDQQTAIKIANDLLNSRANSLSLNEITQGLKEALKKGSETGVVKLSKKNAFFNNPSLRIFLPPEARKIEKKLHSLGFSSLTKKMNYALNAAAEDAMKEALPIFVSAISQMTFADAKKILQGPSDAATEYLKRTTSSQIYSRFEPQISQSLDRVAALKYWSQFVKTAHSVPFLVKEKLPLELKSYVTNKALDGLFAMIAKEELQIRQNPRARTTEILKKVFGKSL